MGDLARYVAGSDLRPAYNVDLYSRDHPTEPDNVYPIVLKEANLDGLGRVRHLIGQDVDPETPAGVIAVYGKEIDGVIELCMRDESNGPVLQLTKGGALANNLLGDYMGMGITYGSATNVTLASGEVEIGGNRYVFTGGSVNLATLNGGALGNNTWYFIRLDVSGAAAGALNTSDLGLRATAPVWSAAKNGWYDGTETDDRCPIETGWLVRTDGSGNILPFAVTAGQYMFTAAGISILSTSSPALTMTAIPSGLPALGRSLMGNFSIRANDFDGPNSGVNIAFGDETSQRDDDMNRIAGPSGVDMYVSSILRQTDVDGNIAYCSEGNNDNVAIKTKGFFLPMGGI